MQQLDPNTTPAGLCKQYLRVIGNCVADNGMQILFSVSSTSLIQSKDTNREAVVKDVAALIPCLKEEELAFTAFAVMLNLCNDFGKFHSASGG